MSWFRTFIRRHLIADDTAPQYSRLGQLDGLTAAEELDAETATPASGSRGATLTAIEARLTADEDEYAGGVVDQNVRDRRYLLVLVREQAAQIDRVSAIERRLERSRQVEDREIAHELRDAINRTDRA